MRLRRAGLVLTCLGLAAMTGAWGADPPSPPADAQKNGSTVELQHLKDLLSKQQEQIESLRAALEEQKKLLEQMGGTGAAEAPRQHATPADRLIASSTPTALPPAATTPAPKFADPTPQKAAETASAPLQLQLGNITIMPVGFMDATMVWRDKNAGSGIGSNFGSVPYNNGATGKLSEFRFSPQNSRLGFRIDGNWKGAHFIGYNEFDFLGTSGANNIGVTNGAFVPRIRLFWVDVRKDQFEFLAGQSWSMMTPSRKGISALPGDLFYSQVIDVNYMIGLPWSRQPGVRFLYHPDAKVTVGFSLENPNQYGGGYGGGPQITPPAALAALLGSQLDNGTASFLSTPNLHPDIIAKLAFDPSSRVHFEVAGVERTFKVYNTVTAKTFTKAGGGGSVNANFEVVKNFRIVTNNFWGDGVGRYIFGNAPDVVLRADGSLSPIHAGGFVEGFEAQATKNLLLYGYFGEIYIGRNTALDANGTSLIGYGFRGSSNAQNRSVQEGSIGFAQTFWKDPKYGALSFMGQYEYLTRRPWYVAANAPKATHDNTIYLNLRYTLPGGAPPAK